MPKPRYRALLIGNSIYYRDPGGLPELHGPKEDVKALQAALAHPDFGMFEDPDIEPLFDRRVQDLRVELEQFYIHDATRDDVLLLYYSGHGKLDISNRLHLCASDTQTSSLRSTALRYKEDVEEFINESPAAATITVLDCCHSGGFRGGKLMVEATGSGRCVLTSSAANQLAIDETRPGGPSPFTEVLVRGLQLAEAQLHLTTQELYEYVKLELNRPGQAKPQYYFNGAGSIILARRAPTIPTQAPPVEPAAPETVLEVPPALSASETTRSADTDIRPVPAEPAASPVPEWNLPTARDRLEHMLGQAVDAALWTHLEDPEREEVVIDAVAEAADAKPEWAVGILEGLPLDHTRQLVVTGLVSGLFDRHRDFLTEFIDGLGYSSPDEATAKIAYANLLPENETELILSILEHVCLSARFMEDGVYHSVPVLTGLCSLFLTALTPEAHNDQFSDSLINAARSHLSAEPSMLDTLLDSLNDGLIETLETPLKQSYLIEAARRIAHVDPTVAAALLAQDEVDLSPEALADEEIDSLADLATSLLRIDHSLAFGLFNTLNDRCASREQRGELLNCLLNELTTTDHAESTFLDRLLDEIERVTGLQDEAELGQLSHFAEQLASPAPRFAERLLELDPDDDRRFAGYLKAIGPASESGHVAAQGMAAAAERIARAARDDERRRRALLELAQGYAWVDPGHAVQLVKSSYSPHLDRGPAIESIAATVATVAPSRLTDLARAVKTAPDADKMLVGLVKGIAPVMPEAALSIADTIENQHAKSLAFTQFVIGAAIDSTALAKSALGRINPPKARAEAAALLARRLVETLPAFTIEAADSIEPGVATGHAKSLALIGASRAMTPEDSIRSERYLHEAVHYALQLDEDDPTRPELLRELASELAAFDRNRAVELLEAAERGARAFPDSAAATRNSTLAGIMIAWAPLVPANSERIAGELSIETAAWDECLREAALALAAPDPRRAEKVARMIGDPAERNSALLDLIEKLSTASTARAERIAASLPQGEYRARASLLVAKAMARRQSD
ncbi:caspase family protein [Glycomyces sp. NPDC046736]|uniref:caspase family protein n=1 Tax=Glycomyces sp. NPDC046736 TaxID=3155615 RepID=UPI0033E4D5FE